MNFNSLAYIGDVYFELRVRMYFFKDFSDNMNILHKKVVDTVNGKRQSVILRNMKSDFLNEEELDFVRRVRNNKKCGKSPKARESTAFEAFIGSLYIQKSNERLEECFKYILEGLENEKF